LPADLELTLRHDGRYWQARGADRVLRAAELAELDRELLQLLRSSGRYRAGQRVTVHMGFDRDTLPRWLHQYAAHYFNRTVTLWI